MTVTEIRQLLESPYNQGEWKVFLQKHFTNNKLFGDAHAIQLKDNAISKHCVVLGNYEVDSYTNIGIFEVQLNEKVNLTRNRVALRNLIKDVTQQVAGAMVVFVQGDKWRFSYISKRKVKNKETNQIEDRETAPKRYTYLFGKNEKALTAAIRFDRLIEKQKGNIFQLLSLNDFEEAFSVEKLSKEFFKNYKESYDDFVQFLTGKRYGRKGNKYEEQIIHEPNWQLTALFNKDEKQARDFCKRMMGRIVFLYFIQKKGWLAVKQGQKWGEGDQDYLFHLFNTSSNKDDFYARELVPLFFNRLNNEDSENMARELRFPYLNGGLFDDSHDRKYNKLFLPEDIFNRLFETFNNYNFTIYEDAPDEHTVAVDPEMLGHIFENLLEDNKDKGAFYTPKEIVHYMCKESLKAYLFAHDEHFSDSDLAQSAIDKIIQQQELSNDEKQYAEKNAYKIIAALEEVKICDPAIGSGAFPMGLLQEIFNALIYLQELKGFKKGVSDADIKKHIIEESIYGVDIDAGAVDIARLRFWLSLVVDEQEPQPLPNLDFKIVCANTLIPLGDIKELDLNAKAALAVRELEELRHEFFNVSSDNKLKLERQFKKIQTDLLSLRELASKNNYGIYTKLYEFNPFDDNPCSWFDPKWMFGINDGFDIVIGNPPYVQLQKDGGKLAKLYEKIGYSTFERTGDIYSLFYEKGFQLLRDKGVLTFITSNKWMRTGYGESLRNYFVTKTNPLWLIDFGGFQVFDATVDTNILIAEKAPFQNKVNTCVLTKDFSIENMSDYFRQHSIASSFTKDSWVVRDAVAQRIKQKVEAVGVPLKDWNINIYRGILTGYNEAFIIDSATRDKLLAASPNSADIIRPILRGRDIEKYLANWAGLYIIGTFPSLNINIDEYPAIKEYLLSCGFDRLKQTGDAGARKKTNNKWFETQDSISYWEDFFRPKIMYPNMTKYMPFIYDNDGYFINDKGFIITGENLAFLTAFFNSSLFKFCFRENFPELLGGTRELRKIFFDKIPVVKIANSEAQAFESKITEIQKLKNENKSTTHIEIEIDNLIFDLYKLSATEIESIGFQEII